jgi:hypothetical protein
MAGKLYPGGQGSPVYYQTRRPVEPQVGSTICLDKTYLLDTVLRLEQDGLRGLQYALDNLHYAQVGGWVGGGRQAGHSMHIVQSMRSAGTAPAQCGAARMRGPTCCFAGVACRPACPPSSLTSRFLSVPPLSHPSSHSFTLLPRSSTPAALRPSGACWPRTIPCAAAQPARQVRRMPRRALLRTAAPLQASPYRALPSRHLRVRSALPACAAGPPQPTPALPPGPPQPIRRCFKY